MKEAARPSTMLGVIFQNFTRPDCAVHVSQSEPFRRYFPVRMLRHAYLPTHRLHPKALDDRILAFACRLLGAFCHGSPF